MNIFSELQLILFKFFKGAKKQLFTFFVILWKIHVFNSFKKLEQIKLQVRKNFPFKRYILGLQNFWTQIKSLCERFIEMHYSKNKIITFRWLPVFSPIGRRTITYALPGNHNCLIVVFANNWIFILKSLSLWMKLCSFILLCCLFYIWI